MAEKAKKTETSEQEPEIEINEGALTIFEAIPDKQRKEAMQALLTGKTPEKYILTRPARGGGIAKYGEQELADIAKVKEAYDYLRLDDLEEKENG